MVSMYSLLLFCGDCLSVNLEKGVFVVSIDDGWIRFSASSREVGYLVDLSGNHRKPRTPRTPGVLNVSCNWPAIGETSSLYPGRVVQRSIKLTQPD